MEEAEVMHIPNHWVQCGDCHRWHLTIVPCLRRELRNEAINFPIFWADMIIMVATRKGNIELANIRTPYITLKAKFNVLSVAYGEVLKCNTHLIKDR